MSGFVGNDAIAIQATILRVQQVRRDIGLINKDLQDLARNANAAGKGGGASVSGLADTLQRTTHAARSNVNFMHRLRASYLDFAVAGLAVRKVIEGAVGALDKYESKQGFVRALRFNFGNQNQATRMYNQTRAFGDKYGVDSLGLRPTVTTLAGLGEELNQILPIIRGFTALGARGGASNEQLKRGFEQLAQIAQQRQLQGDEVRQISENLIPIRTLLEDAGLGGRIGSKTDPIKWTEVRDALIAFGKKPEAEQMLKEKAEQGSAEWQRFINLMNEEVLPALGKGLTPAVKELAQNFKEVAVNLDPDQVAAFVQTWTEFALGLAKFTPEILGLMLAMKLYRTVEMVRLTISANAAAVALERVAISGGGVGIGGAGGGLGGGIVSGGSGGWRGQAARLGLGAAGAIGGDYLARSIWDHPAAGVIGTAGGALIGGGLPSAIGWAGRGGIKSLGQAIASRAMWGYATSGTGLSGTGAGLGMGAAGTAGTYGVIGLGMAAALIAGLEQMTGEAGKDTSFFTGFFLPGGHQGWFRDEAARDKRSEAIMAQIQKMRELKLAMKKRYGWSRLPSNAEVRWIQENQGNFDLLKEFLIAANGGMNHPLEQRSPRQGAMDSRDMEGDLRSIRHSQ